MDGKLHFLYLARKACRVKQIGVGMGAALCQFADDLGALDGVGVAVTGVATGDVAMRRVWHTSTEGQAVPSARFFPGLR